jgi:hypothetical protein
MRRISDRGFWEQLCPMDRVFALRIQEGEFYFLGWMEDAQNYRIMVPKDPMQCQLSRDLLLLGEPYTAIEACDGYQRCYLAYETNEEGHPVQEDDAAFENAYEAFLSYVNPYERNGIVSSDDDHEIFLLGMDEFAAIVDSLRDGDYVFLIDDAA